MKSRIGIIALFFSCILWISTAFGQLEPWVCAHADNAQNETGYYDKINSHQINSIVPLPTFDGINFKVAVLYFKDADDNFPPDPNDPAYCRVNSWPKTSNAPNWIGQLLVPTKFNTATVDADTAARPYSITTYFYQMSGGNIWIYGNEYVYPHTTVLNTPTNRTEWHSHNRTIHQWLIDTYVLDDLDNNGDGSVDMIIFLNRAGYRPEYMGNPGSFYQGVADGDYLPSPVDINGAIGEPIITGRYSVLDNSGVYARNIYDLLDTYVVLHEIGHQLRRGGHLNGQHRWNLMSGAGSNPPTQSGLVMSS